MIQLFISVLVLTLIVVVSAIERGENQAEE